MNYRITFFFFAIIFSINLIAQNKIEKSPKLIVGISINDFYPEWFKLYDNDFKADGLKKIYSSRKLELDYGYLFSRKGCDHATIYSGSLPKYHGIVSSRFYNILKKRREEIIVSYNYSEIGGGSLTHSPVPKALQSISMSEIMKMYYPDSKYYSIGINGEDAVLSGGHSADMAIWMSEKTGNWVSSNYYAEDIPSWLKEENAKKLVRKYLSKGWSSSVGGGFTHELGNSFEAIKTSPYANKLVNNLALKIIENEKLGQDNTTDMLTISYSCMDYKNKEFSIKSPEFKDLLLNLDEDIEKLLRELDDKVGKDNYIVFMTFVEARELLPEDLKNINMNAGYFSIYRSVSLLSSYLVLKYGAGDWIEAYDEEQIYLNKNLISQKNIDMIKMQQDVVDFFVQFKGVAGVWASYSLSRTSGEQSLIQSSFSQNRSGDILYTLLPYWSHERKNNTGYKGSSYSKRHNVPLYLLGGAWEKSELKKYAKVIDIVPTLCRLLNIPVPYMLEGEDISL